MTLKIQEQYKRIKEWLVSFLSTTIGKILTAFFSFFIIIAIAIPLIPASLWKQTFPTLIGVTIGFVFSLLLFWFKEYISYKRKKTRILKCLDFEFEYNLNLYEKALKQVEVCITAIDANDANSKNTYLTLNYELVTILFAKQFYKEGLFLEYLPVEGIERWNNFLGNCSVGSDEYIDEQLEKWRKSKITQKDILLSLRIEENHLKDAILMLNYLKENVPAK